MRLLDELAFSQVRGRVCGRARVTVRVGIRIRVRLLDELAFSQALHRHIKLLLPLPLRLTLPLTLTWP